MWQQIEPYEVRRSPLHNMTCVLRACQRSTPYVLQHEVTENIQLSTCQAELSLLLHERCSLVLVGRGNMS
jgi:hypothetical protein